MPRGEEVFSKIEPAFALGRTEAGRRLRSLSKLVRLAYYDLWNLAVDLRQDVFLLDRATEKALLSVCDFSRPAYLRDCLTALAEIGLVELKTVACASAVRQPCANRASVVRQSLRTADAPATHDLQIRILYVREKHRGYRFKDSPNGERTPPELSQRLEVRVESTTSSSVGSPDSSVSEEAENSFSATPAVDLQASPTAQKNAVPENLEDSPAVRLLEKLRERWEAVSSVFFKALARTNITAPEELAEIAVKLQGEEPRRGAEDALLAVVHHLEALEDTSAHNPYGAAICRARDRYQLRSDAKQRLLRALQGSVAASAPVYSVKLEAFNCPECGQLHRWARYSPEDAPPPRCKACEFAAGKKSVEDALRCSGGE